MKNVLIALNIACLFALGFAVMDLHGRDGERQKEYAILKERTPRMALYNAMTAKNFQKVMSDFGIRLSQMERRVGLGELGRMSPDAPRQYDYTDVPPKGG